MNLFEENLKKWSSVTPEGNSSVDIKEVILTSVEFCSPESGMSNLKKKNDEGEICLHSNDPLLEAQEWFSSLDLKGIQTLYVYGIGLGYYYDAAEEWLKQDRDRYLVFLEDDPEVIRCFLETEKSTSILNNPQTSIFLLGNHQVVQLSKLTSLFSFSDYILTGLKSYIESKPRYYSEYRGIISFMTTMHQMLFTETSSYGAIFFRNFFLNYLNIAHSYLANNLLGKFEGIPAIICGAGPSLDKNVEVLATLHDRALIFAGGTALNALNGKGVMPHFGVGIDPNPDQFTRLVMNHAYETPFLYRCRMLYEALEMVHGDKLYVTGSGGYDVGKWIEKELGIDEPEIAEGFNVLNFSLLLAHSMGCNPIICVGIDLAYSKGDSYASGVVNHPIHNRKSHFRTKNVNDELIAKNDIYGNQIYTLWKWIAESMWYSQFFESHPNTTLINATEGGIGFPKVENMTLNEVKEKYLSKQIDLMTHLHGEIQNSPLPKSYNDQQIVETVTLLMDSLAKCGDICKILITLLEKESKLQTGASSLNEEIVVEEKRLNEEIAYDVILKKFNEDYLKRKELDHKRHLADKDLISKEDHARQKALLDLGRYEVLKQASYVNAGNGYSILNKHKSFIENTTHHSFDKDYALKKLRDLFPVPVPKNEKYFFDQKTFVIEDPDLQISHHQKFSKNEMKKESLFYPSGKIKLEKFYHEKKLHGPSTFFAENGAVLARSWFIDGQQEGKMWTYYASEALHSLQLFRNGLQEGLQQYFYENELPKSLLPFKQGKLHGEVRLFSPYGLLIRRLTFVEGKRFGKEQIWNEEGVLTIECDYEADRPIGLTKMWHQNGILAKEFMFDKDSQRIESKEWDQNGVLIEQEQGKNDDYFDLMNKETEKLTQSLNEMVGKMSNLALHLPLHLSKKPIVEEDSILKKAQMPDNLFKDLEKLNQEMEHLQSLEIQIKKQITGDDDSKEALWKNPASRNEIEKQFGAVREHMNEDIGKIHEAIKKVISSLQDKDEK